MGMHYTSVPNILKVLNPLFLDDLRERLDEAGDNSRKLLNLRNRLARLRVFDPACRFRNDSERLEKLFDLYTKMAGNRTVF